MVSDLDLQIYPNVGQRGFYFGIMVLYLLHFSFECSQRCFMVFCYLA